MASCDLDSFYSTSENDSSFKDPATANAMVKTERRLFNDEFRTKPVTAEEAPFHQFPRLPPEVRLMVWKCCCAGSRLVRVLVDADCEAPYSNPRHPLYKSQNDEVPYSLRNSLGNTISGYNYRLLVTKFRQWSRTLLHVNKESYHAFTSVYSLSLPLQRGCPSLLHLNPTMDILNFGKKSQSVPTNAFTALLHDCVAYDARRIGIANLAIGRECLTSLAQLELISIHPWERLAIMDLFAMGLRNVYLEISTGLDSRTMLSTFCWRKSPWHYNRSIPIRPNGSKEQATEFTILPRDPRPIDTDLKYFGVFVDPRLSLYLWHFVLAKFGIECQPAPMRTHYLLAISPVHYKEDFDCRGSLTDGIVRAREAWAGWLKRVNVPIWGDVLNEKEWERNQLELLDTAGAWILDSHAFGEVPYPDLTRYLGRKLGFRAQWDLKIVIDLTKQREKLKLMLFDLHEWNLPIELHR
ncbi:hypothetical protein HJFPF1_04303 [Paramyrothecium foliicola]|nr:hypothetical protein HJFPF1_04303 [Paramyrothecium foliicola]